MDNKDRPKKISFPPHRASGRTTRIVDNIIQRLFTDGEAEIHDHHPTGEAVNRVLDIVMRRLEAEHNLRAVPNNSDRPFIGINRTRHTGAPMLTLLITTNKLIEYDG